MARVEAKFSGGVVADPELKTVGNYEVLEFPVYVNHSRKDRDTGEYVDSGDTTKIRVSLWGDLSGEDIRKGDIVEVEGSIVEKTWERQDGTEGRMLQTEFVNSVIVKYRKDQSPALAGASAKRGF